MQPDYPELWHEDECPCDDAAKQDADADDVRVCGRLKGENVSNEDADKH
jgi:hypothetical protein